MNSILSILSNHKVKVTATILFSLPTIYTLGVKLFTRYQGRKYRLLGEELRKKRKEDLDQFVSKYRNKISPDRIQKIVDLKMVELAKQIKKQLITSFEAVLAYSLRAATIGIENNWVAHCSSDILEKALTKAQEYDAIIQKSENHDDLPPYIGVPITVKDSIGVEGFYTSFGMYENYVRSMEQGGEKDSYIIEFLKESGFIPFCQTQGPQGFLAYDCGSNIYGDCYSSWKKGKSAGGSSSGEAAMLGSKCSVFGLGTDNGGSLRNPTSFNGIYSLKPTSHRITQKKRLTVFLENFNTFHTIRGTVGPMARSVDDLIAFYKLTCGNFKNDELCVSTTFQNDEFSSNKKLKIGFMRPLFGTQYSQANQNVLDQVQSFLAKSYEVVEFPKELCEELTRLSLAVFMSSMSLETISVIMWPEQFTDSFGIFKYSLFVPDLIKKLFIKYRSWQTPRVKQLYEAFWPTSKIDHLIICKQFEKAKHEFICWLDDHNIDALIGPSSTIPCFDQGKNSVAVLLYLFGYTIFNATDMPSGIVPIRLVENGENAYNDDVDDHLTDVMKIICQDSIGMPIGVNVSSRYLKEEVALRLMKEIDDEFKFSEKYSNGF